MNRLPAQDWPIRVTAEPQVPEKTGKRTSRQLVQAFFAAVTAGDLPDSLLTPDMKAWTTTQGTMEKAQYQRVINILAEISARPLVFTIDSITAEEDRAVAEVRSEGTLINGEPYSNTYVFVFRIRDGRIASVAEHFNALIVQEKMMPLVQGKRGLPK
jgi:ketosteroid isomerase-like protein